MRTSTKVLLPSVTAVRHGEEEINGGEEKLERWPQETHAGVVVDGPLLVLCAFP